MPSKLKTAIILLLICAIIAMFPLVLHTNSEFGGADGAAEDLITEINPEYKAWSEPLLSPPGGETESLLFCIQTAIGAGILGYGFGVLRERTRNEKNITE